MQRPLVLTIAGLDPAGNAGVIADLRAIERAGGNGAAVIAVQTVQDARGVQVARPVDPELIQMQLQSVLATGRVRAIKTGALGDEHAVNAIADAIAGYAMPVVIDPVLLSTSGGVLLSGAGLAALRERLFERATLITPNIPEAERLTGLTIESVADMERAARELVGGRGGVLVKGGHLAGDAIVDVLLWDGQITHFAHPRLELARPRGTGCRLASTIATALALG